MSCRCASDGNIDYYARPGMCIIELPPPSRLHPAPSINIPKFCRTHFILLIYPRERTTRIWRVNVRSPRTRYTARGETRAVIVVLVVVLKPSRLSLSMTAPRRKFAFRPDRQPLRCLADSAWISGRKYWTIQRDAREEGDSEISPRILAATCAKLREIIHVHLEILDNWQ